MRKKQNEPKEMNKNEQCKQRWTDDATEYEKTKTKVNKQTNKQLKIKI